MLVMNNFIALFVESAPYLLLGMLIAGAIHHLIPRNLIEKTLGKKNAVVTAAFIGAPLPLCSCSVIPVAMGIRRSGASKASTASFLVSTPETGVDSIGITYALMGPVMAIARPIAAIFSAIVTGFSIAVFGKEKTNDEKPKQINSETSVKASCCSAKSGCSSANNTNVSTHNASALTKVFSKSKEIVVYGFDKLLADFVWWLLIGLFFAALIVSYVPNDWMASYGTGPLAMLLMVLISIPMYICATASTPIAVGLILAGISPGAALVFMLTGPATNIATLMVIKRELGQRELWIYLSALISSALAAGLAFDYVMSSFSLSLDLSHGMHSDMLSVVHQLSAVVLAFLVTWQVVKLVKNYRKVNHSHA